MQLSNRQRAYLAMATAMILLGASVPVNKALAEDMPANLIPAVRMPIAIATILVTMLLSRTTFPRISRHDHFIMILQTIVGVVTFNLFLVHGLTKTSAVAGGILTSSTPAFVAIFALMLGERLNRVVVLGIGATILGVVALNTDDGGGTTQFLGIVLLIGAVISEALYTITGKMLGGRVTPLANAFFVGLYGMVMLLPFGWWELRDYSLSEISPGNWLGLVYLAVFVFVISFWCWIYGLQYVSATNAGVFTGLIPIATLVCASLFLGEHIRWQHLMALMLVLAGIYLVSRGSNVTDKAPIDSPTL